MGGNKMYLLSVLLLAGGIYVQAQGGFGGGGFGGGGHKKTYDRNTVKQRPDHSIFSKITGSNMKIEDEILKKDGVFSAHDVEILPTLMEGDIVVNTKLRGMMDSFRAGGIGMYDAINYGAWPNGVVPYTYINKYTRSKLYAAVNLAVTEYNTYTCIRWKEMSARAIRSQPNRVVFFIGGGCFSMIGKQGGAQKISLGRGCETKGVAIHEMMHALGFFHEQSRLDRDTYITINWNNIPRSVWYNFQKYRPNQASTLGAGYDKKSIMHYGNYAFTNNRRKTIVSRQNANEKLGQRNGLSVIDKQQLNAYYKCKKGTTKPTENKCKNKHIFCKVLGEYCTNNWVNTNCKATCKSCPGVKCEDKSTNCPGWARQYCKGSYKVYMATNCPKSCKICS